MGLLHEYAWKFKEVYAVNFTRPALGLWFWTPYLYHLLADSHECIIQFWVHHLCLLQLKNLLVATGT